MFETVSLGDDAVRMLDQRLLPEREIYLRLETPEAVAEGIREMAVRGAPAIGVSAAFGLALAARQAAHLDRPAFEARLEEVSEVLAATRPTAVNLFWAIRRMRAVVTAHPQDTVGALVERLVDESRAIHDEDVDACRRMGAFGADLMPEQGTVLTHCNAGALATAGQGTALGVIRSAVGRGKRLHVLADETRPWLQGARLTAWELAADGIDVEVITDSMAGHFMQRGLVQACVVGSDRIAANGDVANKIGTYPVAVLAQEHGIPFFVAAPLSTVDFDVASGEEIPIEERDPDEVTRLHGRDLAPEGVGARHPAFDVTPARLVKAIITERGVARAPYTESLRRLAETQP